jgi:hypothetical protein
MATSTFAQPACDTSEDCLEEPLLICLDNVCVECEVNEDCAEGLICTEENVCVEETPMVSVDIKPGSCQNPLNVRSRGVLPVAILGSEEFDIESINPESIGIPVEEGDPIKPIRYSYEDVGTPSEGEPCICDDTDEDELDDNSEGDGFIDLTLKFRTQELVEGLGLRDIESKTIIPIALTMETEDGVFAGEDCVKIINNFKWWDDLLKEIMKPKKPKKPKGPKNDDDE